MFGPWKKPLTQQPPQGAVLTDIRTEGRLNIFTFTRQGRTFEIETISLLSDNPDQWRKLAGLQPKDK